MRNKARNKKGMKVRAETVLEIFKTSEFWIALALVAGIMLGTGALKKYLKRAARRGDKGSEKNG